jgi:hypothetical protein
VQGVSSKKIGYDPEERGSGLRTSINLITKSELQGELCIISGTGGYLAKHNEPPVYFSFKDYHWNGVIIAIRLQRPNKQVDIYEYIK